jgi:hypothetical protein
MKLISLFLFSLLLFLCGIGDAIGPGNNISQRYIQRQVNHNELVGTWSLTTGADIIQTYASVPDSPAYPTPWKSIILNDNGTCHVDFESSWYKQGSDLGKPDALATCTWKLDTVTGPDKDLSYIEVPGIDIYFDYLPQNTSVYEAYMFEYFIAEENNQLVLWNFIGDIVNGPFSFQDFKKVSK